MRGSAVSQAVHLLRDSGVLEIGCSKHESKESARVNGAVGSAEIGKECGIFSYRTASNYLDIWIASAKYIRSEFYVKNLEKITPDHIAGFLRSKLADGISYNTVKTYAAALEKMEVALNRYSEKYQIGKKYEFTGVIKAIREEAREVSPRGEMSLDNRAYIEPRQVISALNDSRHQIAAKTMLEGGARIFETSLIRADQLRGYRVDGLTGARCGVIYLKHTKGGEGREIMISPLTYAELQKEILEEGKFSFKRQGFRDDLKSACDRVGERYSGAHGLRYSFAQRRYSEYLQSGSGRNLAYLQVSEEMGHHRPDITERYLMRGKS